MEYGAQTVTGHYSDQAGHVNHARHDAPESGLADLAYVRVRGTVGETQTEAHRQRGRVQHRDRIGVPEYYPADDAGHAGYDDARFLAVVPLRVAGQTTPDRLAQVENTSWRTITFN